MLGNPWHLAGQRALLPVHVHARHHARTRDREVQAELVPEPRGVRHGIVKQDEAIEVGIGRRGAIFDAAEPPRERIAHRGNLGGRKPERGCGWFYRTPCG